MPALLLVVLLALTGCSATEPKAQPVFQETTIESTATSEPAREECKQLALAHKVIVDTEASMKKQYDDEYFEGDTWIAFVDGYWNGFWSEHKHCKICQTNGDVPEE